MDLKDQQRAWAIAWQDHGDREAFEQLCHSMEGLVRTRAGKLGRGSTNRYEELVSDFRLAVVEAATKFDRSRTQGFSGLCYLVMQGRAYAPIQHEVSPATLGGRNIKTAPRVAISTDAEDVETAHLSAPEPYQEADQSLLLDAIEAAGLSYREGRVLQRYARGESCRALGEQLGISKERVRQIEVVAAAKVRAVLSARGLGPDDLL